MDRGATDGGPHARARPSRFSIRPPSTRCFRRARRRRGVRRLSALFHAQHLPRRAGAGRWFHMGGFSRRQYKLYSAMEDHLLYGRSPRSSTTSPRRQRGQDRYHRQIARRRVLLARSAWAATARTALGRLHDYSWRHDIARKVRLLRPLSTAALPAPGDASTMNVTGTSRAGISRCCGFRPCVWWLISGSTSPHPGGGSRAVRRPVEPPL